MTVSKLLTGRAKKKPKRRAKCFERHCPHRALDRGPAPNSLAAGWTRVRRGHMASDAPSTCVWPAADRPPAQGNEARGFFSKSFLQRKEFDNDPSAGSPTETLLRLLLPLNAQVWESSRATLENESSKGPVQIPH